MATMDGVGTGDRISRPAGNSLSDDQLSTLLHDGLPGKGMPGFPGIVGPEKAQLIVYLRTTIRLPLRGPGLASRTVELIDGKKLTGTMLNESSGTFSLELTTIESTFCGRSGRNSAR